MEKKVSDCAAELYYFLLFVICSTICGQKKLDAKCANLVCTSKKIVTQ